MAKPDPGFAPAKVNLTLHVTGQRADGYHLLDSLVVFVDRGDRVSLSPHGNGFTVSGPFGSFVPTGADNLVNRAKALIAPDTNIGIHLEKNLPPASGIGGGSSDAAATLHLLAKGLDLPLPSADRLLSLGADLPVCVAARTCRMSGVGEAVIPVQTLPDLHLVLVNPGVKVSTPAVFSALRQKNNPPMSGLPTEPDLSAFCGWLGDQRNDLEAPAIALEPSIAATLDVLSATGPLCARMSGSGATCFGVYADAGQARQAAGHIAATAPSWWVTATTSI